MKVENPTHTSWDRTGGDTAFKDLKDTRLFFYNEFVGFGLNGDAVASLEIWPGENWTKELQAVEKDRAGR